MNLLTSIILLANVATSATFCQGVRLDKKLSYHQFLQQYALSMDIQEVLTKDENYAKLAELKYRAYMDQAPNVKRGQVHLCGKQSANWND